MFGLFKCSNSRSFRLQCLYFILFWSDMSSKKDVLFESSGALCRARSPVSVAQKNICLTYFGSSLFFLSPPFERSLNKNPVQL